MNPHRVFCAAVPLVVALLLLPNIAQASRDIEEFHAFLLPEISSAEINDQVVVTFEVDSTAKHFNGYGITIQWDPGIVEFLSVEEGALMANACPDTWFDYPHTDSTVSVAHILLCEGVSIDGPGVLTVYTFRALENGTTPLAITTSPDRAFFDAGLYIWPSHPTYPRQVFLHNASIVVGLDDVPYGPDDALGRGLRMEVVPNPIRGEGGWIQYQLAVPAEALAIEILDVSGRQLRSWGLKPNGAGAFELRWEGTDENGRPLPMGTYFYRAQAAGCLANGKFQVIR